jgi:hypothetical protein
MALVLKDRVQETATANTTVSFTMLGAATGYQSFSSIGNTNTTYYAATDASGNWEAGIGTYSTTGPTLTRTTILSSSNAGSAVTFVGTVTVFVTYPSSKSVNLDASGNVSALGTVASGTWNGTTMAVAYGGTGATTLTGYVYGNGTSAMTASASIPNSATTATSANTASTIVARDASGNFTAGTITAALSGTASNITSQANSATIASTSANTASTIVSRDASGNFSAGVITASVFSGAGTSLTGTAASLTVGAATTATTATNQSGGTVSATTGAFSGAVTFAGGSGVGSTGDIVARRSSGTTGVYYFVTNGGSVYLYYDGTNFSLNGGSFTCSGNVTAYSDERVKTNWRGYGPDFIERLAKVKHGTFDRTDTELTQDGVSAQSLQELLPYSVMENTEGKLSVSYGNAALVAAVKLAERVVALEARLAALEAKG